jgi:hypothetical protein
MPGAGVVQGLDQMEPAAIFMEDRAPPVWHERADRPVAEHPTAVNLASIAAFSRRGDAMRRRTVRRPVSLLAMVLAALSIGSSLAAAGAIVAVTPPPTPAAKPRTVVSTAKPTFRPDPPKRQLAGTPSEQPTEKVQIQFGAFEGY